MYKTSITRQGRKYDMVFWAMSDGFIRVSIQGITRVHVIWRTDQPLPWVSYKGARREAARILAKELIMNACHELLCEGGTGGRGGRESHESQLVVAGHVRKPGTITVRGVEYLRRGCVVNAENLDPATRREREELVRTWNTMCEAVGRPLTFEELKKLKEGK